jgi:hypothetical protein
MAFHQFVSHFLSNEMYLSYNVHTDIYTDEAGTEDLDDNWLHRNYSYARTVRDDIDATYALPDMSLIVPVLVFSYHHYDIIILISICIQLRILNCLF